MNRKLKEAEVLQENYIIPDSIYDGRFNKTTQFMLPAISINVTQPLVFKFFENAFLADRQHKHNYERPIFMLFSVPDYKDKDWKTVYSILTKSKNYITEYDVGIRDDKYFLMLVFSVPEEFEKDYNNFRIGRYSLFSENYRKKFPEYLDKEKKRKNIHWKIINKSDDLRKEIEQTFGLTDTYLKTANEIWDIPRKEREYYRFNTEANEQ